MPVSQPASVTPPKVAPQRGSSSAPLQVPDAPGMKKGGKVKAVKRKGKKS